MDLVLEQSQRVVAAEIKSGQTLSTQLGEPLVRFSELIKTRFPDTDIAPVLVHGGDQTQSRSSAKFLAWRRLHDFPWK